MLGYRLSALFFSAAGFLQIKATAHCCAHLLTIANQAATLLT